MIYLIGVYVCVCASEAELGRVSAATLAISGAFVSVVFVIKDISTGPRQARIASHTATLAVLSIR